MSVKTFAAIEVGSFELSMKMFEFSAKNGMREIDCVRKRIDLGSDTYSDGKISNEKVDELCRTLREFEGIMKLYKVEDYRAFGTSAIRETENTTIILDQIEQRTGIHVGVLSNSEQRFLDYKAVASKGETFSQVVEQRTAILDIGGGSIQISLFENDTLVSTQNLLLGAFRIQEYINRFDVKHGAAENFIVEMALAQLNNYKKLYLKDKEITNLIIIDEYIAPWAVKQETESGKPVDMETLIKLKDLLGTETTAKMSSMLGMSESKVPLMFVSAVLTDCVAKLMNVSNIRISGATLCDGIAYDYAEKMNILHDTHDFEKDIIACAMNISKRYMGSRKRSETLEKITSTIFDCTRKLHGLGKRERLYLRLAAILHDCGKFISMMNIGETSYNIIMATEIIGLSHTEREIVANVVRFNHSDFIYYGQQKYNTVRLDRDSYLIVAKLTAILRLASGLDRSHKQKLKELKAAVKDNQLVLTADTSEDITLEKGFFEEKKDFFEEVYNISPVLKQRKTV